jgi:shikimate dehydrogenase
MMENARVFGVLGDPVDHSLSPIMHNAAFAALGLPHVYLRYRVSPGDLRRALAEANRLGMGGLNLTVPLKEAALPLVDTLTPEAARMQAVNTVSFRRGEITGDNTDGRGFLAALATRVCIPRAPVLLLGAGGSARAVATALVDAGCPRLTIANRTLARAERLARELPRGRGRVEVIALGDVPRSLTAETAVVVNATSTGLGAERIRLDASRSAPACVFVDLVYAPRRTPFLAAAHRAGRATLDGGLMLLHQGALAFTTWTGRSAPVRAMAAALRTAGLALPEPIAGGMPSR